MQVFVYEFCCSCPGQPASLAAEGRAMLSAVTADFARIPGVDVVTLLADDQAALDVESVRVPAEKVLAFFRALAASADWTVVIAPEFNNLLLERCRRAEEVGGLILGCTQSAIELTSDKWRLAQHWRERGIPTPATFLASSGAPVSFPAISKLRFGAGSLDMMLIPDAIALTAAPSGDDRIVQPYVSGLAVSVAFLLGPKSRLALPPTVQHLSEDGHFAYLGGSAPIPAPLAVRATELASRAIDAVPGLLGYVGVDLVLSDQGDQAIEINPRWTTSYLGTREMTQSNLAEVLLRLMDDQPVEQPTWSANPVTWKTS